MIGLDAGFIKEVNRLSGQQIELCYHCHTCTAGCLLSNDMAYGPDRLLRLVEQLFIGARIRRGGNRRRGHRRRCGGSVQVQQCFSQLLGRAGVVWRQLDYVFEALASAEVITLRHILQSKLELLFCRLRHLRASLPGLTRGLTRQSILFARRWMRGSSPRMTG